jgi:beta-aspartyl-dipeptidase (metallo-type)
VEEAIIPWRHLLPTHCNRSEAVFELAVDYARRGGFVDITTSAYPFFPNEEVKPSSCIIKLLASGVPSDRISLSSDAGGSLPEFDEAGNLTGYEIGKVGTIYNEIVDIVTKEDIPIHQAVRFATSNPAAVFGLRNKGRVATGCDADLLVIDEKYEIHHVIAGGRFLIRDKQKTDSLE